MVTNPTTTRSAGSSSASPVPNYIFDANAIEVSISDRTPSTTAQILI